jgi:hypothetical protein
MRLMIVEAGVRCIAFLCSTSIGEGFTMVKKSIVGGLVAGHHGNSQQDDGIDNLACDLHPVTGNLMYLAKELLSGDYSVLYRRMVDVAHAAVGTGDIPQSFDGLLTAYPEGDEAIVALLDNLFAALEARADRFDDQMKSKAAGRRALAVNHHALYDFEDKVAEECVMFARKHLFLINNLFAGASFAKDRKRDLQGGGGGGGGGSASATAGGSTGGNPTGNSMKPSAASSISRSTYGNLSSAATATPVGSNISTAARNARIGRLSNFIERVEARLQSEQERFCETIASALGLGVQDMIEFQHAYDKDKSNQSRLLKAKFSIFNTGMDAFLAQQGEWRVSSSSLRDVLAQQLTQRVLATYTTFFATYSAVKFSKKHMNEYLKYTPAQLEQHLRSFFGRAT